MVRYRPNWYFLISVLFVLASQQISAQNKDNQSEISNGCQLRPETGRCRAAIRKYYFDHTTQSCEAFIWGGCGGLVPFQSMSACQAACPIEKQPDDLKKLKNSLSVWQKLKNEHGNSYQYTIGFSSWVGFSNETTVHIDKDLAVRRAYKASNRKREITSAWMESTSDQLGAHKQGVKAKTMEALYEDCRNILLQKDPKIHQIYLAFDRQGVLKQCQFSVKFCADDCSSGVLINSLRFQSE